MNSIVNHILISMPQMKDPLFGNSVIFMCEHDNKGAMGLIINKRFHKKDLNNIFENIDKNSDGILKDISKIYFGGPILIERGILLHTEKNYSDSSVKISDDFFISSDKNTLIETMAKNKNTNSRLFLGHASWSAGQLEREIGNGDWLVQETSPDFIFNIPHEQIWKLAINSFSIDYSDFASFGGQA